VAEYIACVVGDDDHVISFLTFICDTDASATARAKQLAKSHDVVLWSGERIVTRIVKAQQSRTYRLEAYLAARPAAIARAMRCPVWCGHSTSHHAFQSSSRDGATKGA